MKRLSSWALPIILGVAGVALIIIGSLDLGREPDPEPAADPDPDARVAQASPTPTPTASGTAPASPSDEPTATPTPTPLPDDVVAVQLEIASVGINVLVKQSTSAETDSFPPSDAAYILRSGHQPGRNTNSYIFAHALNSLFKPLWNVQIGAEVLIRMSDDSRAALRRDRGAPERRLPRSRTPTRRPETRRTRRSPSRSTTTARGGASGPRHTDYERLTLQTSQGYNRNWGELVVDRRPGRVGVRSAAPLGAPSAGRARTRPGSASPGPRPARSLKTSRSTPAASPCDHASSTATSASDVFGSTPTNSGLPELDDERVAPRVGR